MASLRKGTASLSTLTQYVNLERDANLRNYTSAFEVGRHKRTEGSIRAVVINQLQTEGSK
jgi:hypothetical protein